MIVSVLILCVVCVIVSTVTVVQVVFVALSLSRLTLKSDELQAHILETLTTQNRIIDALVSAVAGLNGEAKN